MNKNILLTEKNSLVFILLFLFVLFLSSFFVIPYDDSYYYWDWGRHLSLSYFDGPPLIAYFMHLFTFVFGSTIYAINFLGVISIFVTLFFIYKTGLLLFDKRLALNACLLWLLSPLVIHYLFIWVTYDNLLNMFWATTIYFAVKYIKYKRNIDIYFIGCSIGFLLLSKYTGIVLLISISLFVACIPPYRKLFINKHFYCSILLSILIFSPVIFWNYQHDWVSFSYQLSAHHSASALTNIFSYLTMVITRYNILFLLPIFAIVKSFKSFKSNESILLLNFISVTFVLFFLYKSFDNNISKHWLSPFCISSALLCVYYFVKYNLRKLFLMTIVIYFIWSMDYIISYSFFQKYIDGNMAAYSLAKSVGEQSWGKDMIIMTSNWESAAKLLFWLPGKPRVYTLPCGPENQYSYWSQPLMKKIKEKEMMHVLYLDFDDKLSCVKKYFTECEPLPILSYVQSRFRFNKQQNLKLFAYQCRISSV